jgi:hypothetical protein
VLFGLDVVVVDFQSEAVNDVGDVVCGKKMRWYWLVVFGKLYEFGDFRCVGDECGSGNCEDGVEGSDN